MKKTRSVAIIECEESPESPPDFRTSVTVATNRVPQTETKACPDYIGIDPVISAHLDCLDLLTSSELNVDQLNHLNTIQQMETVLGELLSSPVSRDIHQFCALVKSMDDDKSIETQSDPR